MKNPWLSIPASDYEGHMDLPSVSQLSFLNRVFEKSIRKYDSSSLAYLGCATGNGLEHIIKEKTQKVTAIDIHPEYLEILRKRYQGSIPNLTTVEADLNTYQGDGDPYSLIFAALIFEYLAPMPLLMKISHWLEDSGVLVAVLQPHDKTMLKVSDTPYTSLKLLDPIMNLISDSEFRLMAKASALKEIEGERVTLESGKTFYIGAYGKIRY